jgi:hypothetical protein
MSCSFASTWHDDVMCCTVSSNCLQSLHLLSVVVVVIIIIINIIIIIIIIIVISFMQGIYTYIRETNHVPREYSIASVLLSIFMVPVLLVPALTLLYFMLALSEVCV